MIPKIKNCPFCGGNAGLDFAVGTNRYTDCTGKEIESKLFYTVKCLDDYCGCRIGLYEDTLMAVEAWNKRVEE